MSAVNKKSKATYDRSTGGFYRRGLPKGDPVADQLRKADEINGNAPVTIRRIEKGSGDHIHPEP